MYIGVTGITSPGQTEYLLDVVPRQSRRKLMIGVLASDKTLHHGKNSHPNSFPPVARIQDIFFQDPRVLNLIHYYAGSDRALADDMFRLAELGGNDLHGFQLNIPWPDIKAIERYRNRFPGHHIVLQIRADVMRMAARPPREIAEKVFSYRHLINTVLLDANGGLGRKLSTEDMYPILCALTARVPDLDQVIAGGLSAESLSEISWLIHCHPLLGIDAQGKLRTPDDTLDREKARAYVAKGLELFGVIQHVA